MSVTRSHAPRIATKALLALAVVGGGVMATGAAAQAAETNPAPINAVVLHMSGAITLTLDKQFVKKVKAAKATISVKSGGTYSGKKRLVTLPIDSTTTVTMSPLSADLLSKGALVIRRKDGRKVVSQDIAIRIRPTGADLSGTLRGVPGKEFAALTAASNTKVEQTANGYEFQHLPMLVSLNFEAAAKKAHLKGITAGAIMGEMNSTVVADLPSFQLPGLDGLFTPTF